MATDQAVITALRPLAVRDYAALHRQHPQLPEWCARGPSALGSAELSVVWTMLSRPGVKAFLAAVPPKHQVREIAGLGRSSSRFLEKENAGVEALWQAVTGTEEFGYRDWGRDDLVMLRVVFGKALDAVRGGAEVYLTFNVAVIMAEQVTGTSYKDRMTLWRAARRIEQRGVWEMCKWRGKTVFRLMIEVVTKPASGLILSNRNDEPPPRWSAADRAVFWWAVEQRHAGTDLRPLQLAYRERFPRRSPALALSPDKDHTPAPDQHSLADCTWLAAPGHGSSLLSNTTPGHEEVLGIGPPSPLDLPPPAHPPSPPMTWDELCAPFETDPVQREVNALTEAR